MWDESYFGLVSLPPCASLLCKNRVRVAIPARSSRSRESHQCTGPPSGQGIADPSECLLQGGEQKS